MNSEPPRKATSTLEEIQLLKNEISRLKNKNSRLKCENDNLKNQNSDLKAQNKELKYLANPLCANGCPIANGDYCDEGENCVYSTKR